MASSSYLQKSAGIGRDRLTVMRRRTLLSLSAATAVVTAGSWKAYSMNSVSSSVLPEHLLQQLKPSPRMPVMFIGHGSPMNVIEDTHWRQS